MRVKNELVTRHSSLSKGLTLVEILISVALLAFALALILQGLARGAYALALATNRLRAYEFVATKLADVELSGDSGRTSGRFRMGADAFAWTTEVLRLPDAETLELVTLRVAWQQGRREYAEQASAIRRRPPGDEDP